MCQRARASCWAVSRRSRTISAAYSLRADIYGRPSIMFSEGEAWLALADEIIHVGVTAII
ncbi:hypothetical protein EI94DRAFT_1755515 [Lactarius quietus]|nr:hypothetical protein EI94DRAFT_1755515 [Lactarius quietus]